MYKTKVGIILVRYTCALYRGMIQARTHPGLARHLVLRIPKDEVLEEGVLQKLVTRTSPGRILVQATLESRNATA